MLIEDSPAYRQVIEHTTNNDDSLELIDQFASAEGALRNLRKASGELAPDVLLLDLNLPGMSGIEAIPDLLEEMPDTKIIVLTQSGKEADVLAAVRKGAAGYLLKSSSLVRLKDAIRNVTNGGAAIDPMMAKYLLSSIKDEAPQGDSDAILSNREIEVLTLIGEGFVKKEIASELNITHRTVATHIERIYNKLGVKNAPAAVSEAYQSGILPAGDQ